MGEAAFQLVETNEVEVKAMSIVDQAKAVKVVDVESYRFAGELWKGISDMIKEVKETFDPICEAANKAHKAATAKRALYLDPLTSAQRSVKQLMSSYDLEQERIRRAEEARLAEIARKEEEERRLQEAIALEAQGESEVAEAVMAEPVFVAPVVLPKATPKLQGGPVYRTIWKYRIVNPNIIPRQYLKVDEVAIGGVVRSLKGQTNIPGIEPYEERV